MHKEYTQYLKNVKKKNLYINITKFMILLLFILLWEFLSKKGIIDSFIFSSPSQIIKTLFNLINNNLFLHIRVTLKEIIISFMITNIISFILAIIMYENDFIAKVIDPYLVMLNSMPKVSLGPILIIWIGANTKSIITMGILISVIISVQSLYNSFKNTDNIKIKLLKSFNASNKDIIFKLIIPSNKSNIINILKINMSMCIIGVIMGEFLTSKAGIGYLILYGSQVFNINLVMTGIILLLIISSIISFIINLFNKNKKEEKTS